jgi:ATP-dependent Lhr-like helicase
LELGIDIGDVSLTMQYGSPHQVFRLVQRVGRAGHTLKKTPRGVIFTTDFDDLLESEVLCALARNGWLEDKKAERGALDVIAHQLVGLCLDFGRMELSKAHMILSRSYAYSIDYERLRKVALQLFSEGILYYDEEPKDVMIRVRPRAREYYYSYLSTIPKTKRFLMKDITTNRIISSLDEEFVVNLESGTSFLSHGLPWRIVDITDTEVLAEPSGGSEVMVPSWTGEDIPVSFEVAQDVGRMRASKKDISPLPDEKTLVVEIVQDLVIIHTCFGTKVNEALSRIYSRRLSRLIGESVLCVADPYRIMVKLPFGLKEEHIMLPLQQIRDVRTELEEALENSSLLKFKFLHVGRMFGLLSEDANISSRFIEAMRNSAVYEETIRSIFFRYFDVEKTGSIVRSIKAGGIKTIIDKREKPSYFARIGLERLSGGESTGAFAPRERVISGFKENALSKTMRLRCLSCQATRFMHLAGAPEAISCHKCGEKSLALVDREGKDIGDPAFSAGLIRTYGKKALIALSTYGIGSSTADRILKRLHRDEQSFYLDLIEAQRNFIKNKKFWKL